jgi:hypothetical protein
MLIGRVGLTRRRAECFVRLWTYLLLKQQQELGDVLRQPLTQLQVPKGFVACTHREAAELFYSPFAHLGDPVAKSAAQRAV